MARMWHGCQIITENKEWILFQQFEKYICGMCIFCQCPLMLKFSMESLLLVNDLEIWENLFFLTLKLVGKHPRLGKKKPSSVQVQHQQGVVPAKPYSCTRTSLLFGGHEGTEKDPVQKKKKRQTFNKQTNQTHRSSFYQHGSMKIQEKKKPNLGSGQQNWMEREGQPTAFAELHAGLGQASQPPFQLYWSQDPCLYLWSFAWRGMVVSSSSTWKQSRSSWRWSLFQGTENAIFREASPTAVLWCLSSLIMLVLLKKTILSAFAFYPWSVAVQTSVL